MSEALMPVVFTSAIGLSGSSSGARPLGELDWGISQTPQVWIDCQNIERAGGLATTWDVREGVFPDGMVDDMFAAFSTLLRDLAGGDRAWEQACPVSLPGAQRTRRRAVNATNVPLQEALVHEGLVAQALRTPERIAVVSSTLVLTYGDLLGTARVVAGKLAAMGCRPGDIVGVVM